MLKRTFTWLSVGLAIGLAVSMWFGPSFIQWWWKVPGTNPTLSCDPQIQAATEWLVKLQLAVGVTGGLALAIVANLVARARDAKNTTQSPSTAIVPNQ